MYFTHKLVQSKRSSSFGDAVRLVARATDGPLFRRQGGSFIHDRGKTIRTCHTVVGENRSLDPPTDRMKKVLSDSKTSRLRRAAEKR